MRIIIIINISNHSKFSTWLPSKLKDSQKNTRLLYNNSTCFQFLLSPWCQTLLTEYFSFYCLKPWIIYCWSSLLFIVIVISNTKHQNRNQYTLQFKNRIHLLNLIWCIVDFISRYSHLHLIVLCPYTHWNDACIC